MRRAVGIMVSIFLYSLQSYAQDPAFSQFYASPLSLNPALTGKFNGSLRFCANHRTQYNSINNAFSTSTISIDAPLFEKNKITEDRWALGIMMMSDMSSNNILKSNFLSLSTAYFKKIDETNNSQLGIGFQATYVNNNIDGTRLQFENGYDNFSGAWNISPTEKINQLNASFNYLDINAGILYSNSTDGINYNYFGLSLYHLNGHKITFPGSSIFNIQPRITLHAGTSFELLNPNTYLYLSTNYSKQSTSSNLIFGGSLALEFNTEYEMSNKIYIGSWLRMNEVLESLIPTIGLDYNDFSIGLSYDINISSLKTASNGKGGMELSLIYRKNKSSGTKEIPCPTF